MRKLLLLLCVFFIYRNLTFAQVICSVPGSAETCDQACINCLFAGGGGTTAGFTGEGASGFCGSPHNDQWYGFVAGGDGLVTFSITPSGCTMGLGVQIALYPGCGSAPIACNGGGSGAPQTLTISATVTAGEIYYVYIDGDTGDECNFSLTASPASLVRAATVRPSGPIIGPSKLCPGATVTYTITPAVGATSYTWTIPLDATISGGTPGKNPGEYVFDASGTSVTITFGNSGGNISVLPFNFCNKGTPRVKPVTVAPIPPKVLPAMYVCLNEFPYALPWGEEVAFPGTYSKTLITPAGCDSMVTVSVLPRPSYTGSVPIPRYVCASDSCINVCNTTYCGPGDIMENCKTFKYDCDSIINYSVVMLSPKAVITNGATATLSCINNRIVLRSAASPAGSVKTWRNLVGGLLGTGDTLVATAPGKYILNTTLSAGPIACVHLDTITIINDLVQPTVTASVSGQIGCGGAAVSLSAVTNVSNATYTWSGPSGFATTTQAAPSASISGLYTVTVRNPANGCTRSATVNVVGNTTLPSANVTGATLTCTNEMTGAPISVSTNAVNATYLWSGPSAFSSVSANPIVTNAGMYSVTVTNQDNKCTSTATVTVDLDKAPPVPTATTVGNISCSTPAVNLNATPLTGVTYSWSGPGAFSSSAQNPAVMVSGTYTVLVKSNANGCTAVATTNVSGDTNPPNASTTGGTLNCTIKSITLTGNSATAGATYSWAGPAGASSTAATINAITAGTYTLTVRGPNTCTTTATAVVMADVNPPGASATGGTVSCSVPSTTIMGGSPSANVTYFWDGPGTPGNVQNPIVSLAGTYTLTVKGQNGCTSVAMTTVVADAGTPVVDATGGTLNCKNASVALMASATPAGVQLTWSGPSGFSSAAPNPVVTTAGTYTVTALNPANGCKIESDVIVGEDKTPPAVSATGGVVSCANATTTINGNSSTPGIVSWAWAGPSGFVSNQQNPNNVTEPGNYQLTVIGANGCSATTNTSVLNDKAAPIIGATGVTLTCNNASLAISSTSSVASNYNWSGPSGFTSVQQNPVVNVSGIYTVMVTSIGNGCSATTTALVQSDKTPPLVTTIGDTLTCIKLQGTLRANSIAGINYSWQGPGGFFSAQQNPPATAVGTYTVTVTGSNGCPVTTTATMAENKSQPVLSNQNPEVLTCNKDTITINATVLGAASAISGLSWSGPSGFSAMVEDPEVVVPGTYTLTATAQNGCTAQLPVVVTAQKEQPTATATGGVLNCSATTLNIMGSSATANTTYAWTGPGGFASNQQNPSIINPGDYILTVTGSNGCTQTAIANVLFDGQLPNISSVKSNDLDCNKASASLTAASNTNGVTYQWSGPGGITGTQSVLNTTTPGTYIIAVKAPNNCIARDTQTILQNIIPPDANALGGQITCGVPSPQITAASLTAGVTYNWAGPGGFASNLPNPTVTQGGTYTVTVKANNGCISTATAQVTVDKNIPLIEAQTPAKLLCSDTTSAININVSIPAGITQTNLVWEGVGGFASTQEDIIVNKPGDYTVTVGTSNGCSVSTTITVIQDIAQPGATATSGTLTCKMPGIALAGATSINVSDAIWAWTGPNNTAFATQNPTVTNAGLYTLTVTNKTNGCSSVATTMLMADDKVPLVTATSQDTLTCKKTTLSISSAANMPGTYAWSGPGGYSSTSQNPINITQPGTYTVTVKADVNGCTGTQSVAVVQNILIPDAITQGDTLNCSRLSVPVAVTTTASGPRYSWSGPGSFTNSTANPMVSLPGNYVVTVTGYNGCTTTASAIVGLDTAKAVINGMATQVLTCTNKTVGINTTINSSSSISTTTWSNASGYVSAVKDPNDITNPGIYKLVVRTSNGCLAERSFEVKQDIEPPAGINAKGDTLTCLKLAVNLTSSSTTPGVLYNWSGPNGFVNASQNPANVTLPGTYTVTVASPNGCIATQTAIVAQNVNLPDITATSTLAQLDCDDTEAVLNGASTVSNVTYQWVGSGVNDATQQVKTTKPGTYILTIKAPNGCVARDTVTISQDIAQPNATAAGGVIDCISSQTALSGNSTTANVTYSWAGPNNTTFPTQNPTVTQPGTYTLIVKSANGCTATTTAVVNPNVTSPVVNLAGAGTLNCTIKNMLLKATIAASVSPVSTMVWKNAAGNIVSNTDSLRVTAPGVYTFTATSQNGCKSEPQLTVLQNIEPPQTLIATGGKLDCSTPAISIKATSTTLGVTYLWNGPGAYTAASQNPNNVTTAGTYTVVVSNPANGCSSSATAQVTEDSTKPNLTAKTDSLTCIRKMVTLSAVSTTSGVTYQWAGPGGFTAATKDAVVSSAGIYKVVAKGTNACTTEYSVNVIQDIAAPTLLAQGDTITCAAKNGVVVANSTTPNVQYRWSGPSGFSALVAAPTVSETGLYTVVVTALNGCTKSSTVQVSPDQNAPEITASGGTFTCASPSVVLSASANTNVGWVWTGPGGFNDTKANPTVATAGVYTVVGTALANGCSVSKTVEVKADKEAPVITLSVPDILTCTTTDVDIQASIGSSGNYTFQWSTQDGKIISGNQSAVVHVGAAADYTIVVSNSQNGCTASRTAKVIADPSIPSGLGLTNKNISCFGAKNGAIFIDSVKGGTQPLLFRINGGSLTANRAYTGLEPGDYTIEVEDANGCTFETSLSIKEPNEFTLNLGKDTTIALGSTINFSLKDAVSEPDRVKTTQVFPPELKNTLDSTFIPAKSLLYRITVIDSNGCTASDERMIRVDRTRHIYIPTVFQPVSGSGNELFYIQGNINEVEIIKSFLIFDRWGNAVHEYQNFLPNDPASGWNGKQNKRDVNQGVFVYFAEILFKDGETVMYKGDVTIIK